MKTREQRMVYAMRRMGAAIDRIIVAQSPEAKAKAKRWADAWAHVARLRKRT